MATANVYLNFNGNTEEAFNFYKSVFGGEFTSLQRFKDTPEADKLPETDRDKIMHVALPLGNGSILMATDGLESMGQKLTFGNNYHISLQAESKAEADEIFNRLSAGGEIAIPLAKMFWGDYFGMTIDKFGVQWMVNYHYQD